MTFFLKFFLAFIVAAAGSCGIANSSTTSSEANLRDMAPEGESNVELQKGLQKAVFAGGCFWGVEAVFESVKGVKDAKAGYAGGTAGTATYEHVTSGLTDHAESVLVTFDPAVISYTQLLTIFFAVAHDPTELNRQGPDVGRHYRSAIFYMNDEQKNTALAYIEAIDKSGAMSKPVVTEVVPLKKFYDAEPYHQNYLRKNPTQPYIIIHDMPKLEALKAKFPELYVKKN